MNERVAPIVGFLSGKGGVGKSNIAANVAVACRILGAEVLLIDGDLGLANLDALLGLQPSRTAADVVSGRCGLNDAVVEGPHGIHVLAAARGDRELTANGPSELAPLLLPVFEARRRYGIVILDIGSGIGKTALTLSASCDLAVLVTTPELTSIVDAYAMLKVLATEAPDLPTQVLVNGTRNEYEASHVHDQLTVVARNFLSRVPGQLGYVPTDARLIEAVRRQRAVVDVFPSARASRLLVGIAKRLLDERAPGRRSQRPPADDSTIGART